MKRKKVLSISILFLIISLVCIFNVFAHSGKTDARGGHRDNKNYSGLGNYHYHCDGYPPHLHTNGVCQYKAPISTKAPINTKSIPDKQDSETTNIKTPIYIAFGGIATGLSLMLYKTFKSKD